MSSILAANTAINEIQDTSDGKIEYAGSLEPVVLSFRDLIQERGLPDVANTSDLGDWSGAEASKILVVGVGIFVFYDDTYTPAVNRYAAQGSGYWEREPYASLAQLSGVTITSPATGDALKWDGNKWVNGTFAVAWANISGIPSNVANIPNDIVVESVAYQDPAFIASLSFDKLINYPDLLANYLGATSKGVDNITAVTNTNFFNWPWSGDRNLIMTNQTQVRSGSGNTLEGCVLIGRFGNLPDTISGGAAMADILAIGVDGKAQFYVDANGRIGIGQKPTSLDYDVELYGTGGIKLTGPTIITGSLTGSGGLTITGDSSLTGQFILTGGLTTTGATVLGGNLSVAGSGTNVFSVTGGTTTVAGTFNHTGPAFTLSGAFGSISSLPVYADNTAAIAGGLPANRLYRTSTGQQMVRF